MSAHPPIPPNCPYFKNSNGWHFVIHPYPKEEVLFYLGGDKTGDFSEINRPVIASVAYAYWMKEYIREHARAYKTGDNQGYMWARAYADDWLKWGGLK